MRRSAISAVVIGLLVVVVCGLVFAPNRSGGWAASPAASPAAGSYVAELVDEATVVPAASPVDDGVASPVAARAKWVVVTRVTLSPDGEVPKDTEHKGPSVLLVQTGTVCFTLLDASGGDVRAETEATHAPDETATPATDGCPPLPAGCAPREGCPIADAQSVLLHEGDSVSTSVMPDDLVLRGYRNVGDKKAIVLISDYYEQDDTSAPCGGGCP